ncbi:hypothetical protein AB0I77_27450 [Streptomyces sp. NPDC050619]
MPATPGWLPTRPFSQPTGNIVHPTVYEVTSLHYALTLATIIVEVLVG